MNDIREFQTGQFMQMNVFPGSDYPWKSVKRYLKTIDSDVKSASELSSNRVGTVHVEKDDTYLIMEGMECALTGIVQNM